MTFNNTCLIIAGPQQGRTNWRHVLANLGDDIVARRIFDIAFAARFAQLPFRAKLALSRFKDTMVTKEVVEGDPRPKPSELAESILKIANDRDEAAFNVLFRYFAPRIKSYCLRIGADTSSAEEITQEAMVSIWRNAAQFDPSKSSPSTWIFTIARNLTIDRFRRTRRPQFDPHDPALVPDDQPAPDRLVEEAERQGNIRSIMETLSSNERNVLMLSFYESFSHSEISKRLGIPVGTVKSRIRLAFAKIRSSLDAQNGADR